MFAALPFVADLTERFELLAMKCLTVLGGFVAGYVAGRAGGWGFDRYAYKGKTPDGLKKLVATILGLAVALLVALLIFRFGEGGGTGGGRGAGEGSGKASASPTADPESARKDDETPPPKVDPVPTPEKQPGDVSVAVTFLGGTDVVGDRFYQVGDDRLTFDALKAVLTRRKAEAGGKNTYLLVQFPAANRIADDSVNVTQVTEWAKNAGFQVVFPGSGK